MAEKSNKRTAKGTGTIRKKTVMKNGKEYTYWEGRLTIGRDLGTGKQRQRSFTGKTQKEVREKMQAVAVELNEKTYQEPNKITLGEWLDIWYAEYLGDVKPYTLASYEMLIRVHIKPALGAVKLTSLVAHDIQRFYNSLADTNTSKLSAKSIKNVHGVMHSALQQAVENQYIRSNPSDACKLPRIVKKELKPLDEKETADFLNAIKGHKFEAFYKVTLFTGMRESEAIGLTWDCVDFKAGTIRIEKQLHREKKKGGQYVFETLKNNKTRTVTPPPSIMRYLKHHQTEQIQQRFKACELWENSGLVFTDELGHHLASHTIYTNFKKIAASIGRPDLRVHDLRHTFAVTALQAGVDFKSVQSYLGHATAAFTLDVYGHVTPQMDQKNAAQMEKCLKVFNL